MKFRDLWKLPSPTEVGFDEDCLQSTAFSPFATGPTWEVDYDAETLEAALKPYTFADTRLDALVQLYGGAGVIRCPYRWAAAMRRSGDGVVLNRADGVRHLVVWNLEAVRLKEIE